MILLILSYQANQDLLAKKKKEKKRRMKQVVHQHSLSDENVRLQLLCQIRNIFS